MKLYIPTTSLNFNNILSTESISPKGFYALREFGYSRWFSIPENDYNGAILLYESPADIIRPISDIEDHPLLIEIESDEDFPLAKDGIRYSKHTIYLNPWNTTFWFQTEKDKTIALSLSDSSLETKMLRLYARKIRVASFQQKFTSLDGINVDQSVDDASINQDKYTNKIKGLLYGYFIGSSLSASKEDVEKLNTLREIQNIFAAIISSLDNKPSQIQMERLEVLFGSFAKQEPLYRALLKEIGVEETTDNVVSILQRFGVSVFKSDWRRIVNELQYENGESNYAINWIKSEIDKLKREISLRRHLLSTNAEEIITSNGKVSKVSSINDIDENKLYISWINDILIQSRYNGKVSSLKEELADTLTKSAISTLGDKWNDSDIRTFLNQLRKHVRGEEFTQPWANGVLSSIAAVITKGDDWEPLLQFMQSKGMTDYRLAFSFYGILNGFANLTRDFTDILLNQNNEYVADVYREFYGQLHGVSIDVSRISKQEPVIEEQSPKEETETEVSPLDSFVGHKETPITSNIIDEIWQFFRSSAFKGAKKKDELTNGLRLCLERNKQMTDVSQFIFDLNDFDEYGWSKNNKPWKTMQEHFCPDYKDRVGQKKKATKKKEDNSPSIFDLVPEGMKNTIQSFKEVFVGTKDSSQNPPKEEKQPTAPNTAPSDALFINDSNVIAFLDTLPYVKGSHYDEIKKGILNIQKGYQPGGKYAKGGEKESDPANKQVIKHLGHYITYIDKSPSFLSIVQRLQHDLIIRYNVQ